MINRDERKTKFAADKKETPPGKITRLHIVGAILTVCGIALFGYFVYQAGIGEIWNGIARLGFGFLLILALYALKLASRAAAWSLCVENPYRLGFVDAIKAIIIAESLNTIIPLGILISGTSKAIAVHKKLPLVVALSSVAVENLFYSLATALLIIGGAIAFLLNLDTSSEIAAAAYVLIALIAILIVLGFLMVIRQWHFASAIAARLLNAPSSSDITNSPDKAPRENFLSTLIPHPESFVAEVRRFEELIYGFYRKHPNKFAPVFMLQIAFHALGVFEVWFILQAVSDVSVTFQTAFLLESVNRIILVVFKLIPFLLGVDEAGASFITDNLAIGANVGVTLAIIRKGRVLFWAAIGIFLIARSGLSFGHLTGQTERKNIEAEI